MRTDLDEQARAALSLFRWVVHHQQQDFKRGEMTRWFVQAILDGRPPIPVPPVPTVKQ